MNATHRRASACLGILALAFFTERTFAGRIDIEPGAGNTASLLIESANRPVDAMYLLMESQHKAALTQGNRQFFVGLRSRLQKATIARIEYAYAVGDVTTTRVYHAASGHPNEIIFKGAESSKGASSGTESGVGSTDDAANMDTSMDWELDEAESMFYPDDTATDVRAPSVRNDETSELTHFNAEGRPRGADAEFKAFRRIEDDIRQGVVPKGGRITGYVSKTVCASCEQVINDFADAYDANGTVYQLLEPPAAQAPLASDPIRAQSQEASRELLKNRKAFIQNRIQKTDPARATSVRAARDIEQSEASLRRGEADGC